VATYVESPPLNALRCDSSELMVIAPDATAALQTAQDPGIDYVREQVEGIAQAAIWKSSELEQKVAAMENPQTFYTLGKGVALYESHWSFPLHVYVADRQS
jgi:hypothetical protein